MSKTVDLSAAEQRAFDFIVTEGGVVQSQLLKALGEDSRKGSRLAQSLEEKGSSNVSLHSTTGNEPTC